MEMVMKRVAARAVEHSIGAFCIEFRRESFYVNDICWEIDHWGWKIGHRGWEMDHRGLEIDFSLRLLLLLFASSSSIPVISVFIFVFFLIILATIVF